MRTKARIPEIPKKGNGLPLLSRSQIDDFADHLAVQFNPDIVIHPEPINVDAFIEQFLGWDQDLLYLSHCGCFLGVTIFENMKFPVFNMETFKPEFADVAAHTIIIDAMLYQNMEMSGHQGRFRFTQAHECGHAILHTDFYKKLSVHSKTNEQRAAYSTGECHSAFLEPDDMGLAEQQANCFASCLLMPKSALEHLIKDYRAENWCDYDLLLLVKETFNTSWQSAFYRLKDLGYMEGEKFDWESLRY